MMYGSTDPLTANGIEVSVFSGSLTINFLISLAWNPVAPDAILIPKSLID